MTRSGSVTGSGRIRTACAMLKMAVTSPMATARMTTTVVDKEPPRRTFLNADLTSAGSETKNIKRKTTNGLATLSEQIERGSRQHADLRPMLARSHRLVGPDVGVEFRTVPRHGRQFLLESGQRLDL